MINNTMKTTVLLASLGGLIVGVATLLGGGSSSAVMIGLALALLMVGGSYWFSDKLALASAKAVVVQEHEAPEFYRLIKSLADRAGLPMPRVAISPSEQPNAFATGRGPRHAVVCATQGLLRTMPADELEGVMAHELMHVKHRDILIGSVAAAVATGISAIANMAMFAGMFGGGDDEDRPNPLVVLLLAMVAPIAASVMQMALSRSREFEADRGGAELLGDPRPLASALAKLDAISRRVPMNVSPQQATAYIVNPLTGRQVSFARLFLTHPPIEERIEQLLQMRPSPGALSI